MARYDVAETTSEVGGETLERDIGLPMFIVYGVGTIVGAGIFVLTGEVAGKAGAAAPVVFVLAGLIAGITALSYAELGARHPEAGGPTTFADEAFGKPWLNAIIGYGICATGVVSAATIASGFAGYLSTFIDFPEWIAKTGVLLALGVVAGLGAKQSTWVMLVSLVAGLFGLGVVIWGGFTAGDGPGQTFGNMFAAVPDAGAMTMLASIFLAFYAFIGFEDMIHMAEEVKKPPRTIPRGLIVSLFVVIVLYGLTAFAAVSLADPKELADSPAPLVYASEQAGYSKWLVGIASLLILPTGALAQIVMASRVIYDQGRRGFAPDAISGLNETTNTPLVGTAIATGIAIALTFGFPLGALAQITSFIILAIFGISNVALIILDKRKDDAPFNAPDWVPYVGIVLCVVLLGASLFGMGVH